TYREMGLAQQAIHAFREAAREVAFRQRCAEMIGRCLLDEGRFDEAIHELETALDGADGSPEAPGNLRFQLRLAHEAAGRDAEALPWFEEARAAHPALPDVSQKISQLRRAREQT